MPEFAAVKDEPDDLFAAIEAAVGSIAPRIVTGRGQKAEEETAVLREALRYYADSGASDFSGFVDLLDELPEDVSSLRKGVAIAANLAQRLRVARINDPLFAGEGEPVDPGLLLTPPPGKRARVSVISMIGLPDLAQQQSFVNQLQMALFSWIKKHPAEGPAAERTAGDGRGAGPGAVGQGDRVQREHPATGRAGPQVRAGPAVRDAGTESAAQPDTRQRHNAVLRQLAAPAQIGAAREVARAKGGDVPDIGKLTTGQFYVATEGMRFAKTATPLCLSHHPSAPLTEEEVIWRSQR